MANLEDLKKAWQSDSGIAQQRFDQIGSKVRDSTELLQTTIFRRDMRETFASVVVVAAFFLLMFSAKNWVDWSGYAIVVIAGITIPIVLWRARKRSLATFSAANFRDFVDIEIDYLRRQVQLLRMVAWWGLLPIYAGIALISVGILGPRNSLSELVILTVYLAICAGLFSYIWWLNQSARKANLEPLLHYYVEMRTALDSGDEFALQLPDPPQAFLQSKPLKPMTNRQRWIWIMLTGAVTLLVAGAGYATMQSFDARTGGFIVSTTPVVAILMIFVSGIWRRGSD